MIRFLSLFAFVLVLSSVSVMAQENVGEDVDVVLEALETENQEPIKDINAEDNYETRLKLARQMHEIWPIRPKIETALENIAQQIDRQERLRFKSAMRKAIKFEALEEASIDAMADIFNAKELGAMIAFYGSKEGRSVSHKTSDYERALEPALVRMVDKALLDVKLGSQ
jgi:hypothetical protein